MCVCVLMHGTVSMSHSRSDTRATRKGTYIESLGSGESIAASVPAADEVLLRRTGDLGRG